MLLTQAIVGLGDIVSAWGWLLLMVFAVVFWWVRRWGSGAGREWLISKA